MHSWKVVPLSSGQLLDVDPDDVLEGGLYRRCNTYKGGGGYDQFPKIAKQRLGGKESFFSSQFIVQLFGCNLDCPYCYVTREGVWGNFKRVSSVDLAKAFIKSDQNVFHLMGGAPALQLSHWPELINELNHFTNGQVIFHSDLMLTEKLYTHKEINDIWELDCIYAINIKGLNPKEYLKNTRKTLNEDIFWANWNLIQFLKLEAYITFTGIDANKLDIFWELAHSKGIDSDYWKRDSFIIDLIDYEATKHVDDVPWGVQG